jgi:hypothetical protein
MTNAQKTNIQKADTVGDVAAPALRQPASLLANAANTECPAEVLATPIARPANPAGNVASVLKASSKRTTGTGDCRQILWFSFFFDGTGNNLDADWRMSKHSNVARLYGAHLGDENNGGFQKPSHDETAGVYRFYVPGIGTYFKDIGDDGGSTTGLGFGSFGAARLQWAVENFERALERHVAIARNRANKILEVNIAAFGFSRGAALARAFINKFVKDRCVQSDDQKWKLKSCGAPVRIRFLGLFDTVASVGFAMSANNMEKIDASVGNIKTHISTRLEVHRETRPEVLAFFRQGLPGADPAPGNYDGHSDWGKCLSIPNMVEDVRHFIAAHELRNSFPVDSISTLGADRVLRKPTHFHEYVYPGVHSDVGGSYRPGEGGKNATSATKIGLVPLRAMYSFAAIAGVPFASEAAFGESSRLDFELDPVVATDFNYYISKLDSTSGKTLGHAFNAHMKLYYAWRFRSIKLKRRGDDSQILRIKEYDAKFTKEGLALQKKIDALQGKYNTAEARRVTATWAHDDFLQHRSLDDEGLTSEKLKSAMRLAELEMENARENLLKAKAVMNALPKNGDLPKYIEIYDNQLMADAQLIYDMLGRGKGSGFRTEAPTDWKSLRPHYKILIEAYENEFIKDAGLQDGRIIRFFDEYIHDSLAGFGKDGTLPSDPRVIYLGGDEKLKYAGPHPNTSADHIG